jgi:flagellar hook capping protein FlgD/putative pyrroloquinoline-quinone binding quinoprotein
MATRIRIVAAAIALKLAAASAGIAGELLYFQSNDGQSTYGPSQLWPASGVNSEIADDFDLVATIDRVVAGGFIFGTTPEWQGVYVRFYEYRSDGTPGVLQGEFFLPAGDPNLTVDSYGLVDARLPQPFAAHGRHFLAVQPVVNTWYWWSANTGAPHGQQFFYRDAAGQNIWRHGDGQSFSNAAADVEFAIYGTVTGPGSIASLSATNVARNAYLEIFGSNFGSNGTVRIGGASAPIAEWRGDRIVAYVPEAAPLGSNSLQVITPGGTSNALFLNVGPRPPGDRVHWRLRLEGAYSGVRPALGPDGTVYATDVGFRLYAVSPNGAVRWIARGAGNKGLAVGADGSVYVGSESDVKAYAPDGTLRWTFTQNPRANILLGLAVGPDGNIYGVGTQGMGVFSLTPAGALRWTNPENYSRPIVDYGEIVFGPNAGQNQLYFYANDHTRAVRLADGGSGFTLAAHGQPAVSPLDGTVHLSAQAYSPAGALLWSFTFPILTGTISAPDLAADGTHYVVNRMFELYALRPNGSERWHVALPHLVGAPNVDPTQSQVVLGSGGTLDMPGFVQSIDTSSRQQAWRVDLPPEETTVFNTATGQYGFNQFVETRARFTADGSTVYLVTAIATGGQVRDRSFLYSIALGNGFPVTTETADRTRGPVFAVDVSPNPSRDATTFQFELRSTETVQVRVYDVAGRLVRDLGAARRTPGIQSIRWDGRDARGVHAPAGLYLVRFRTGERETVAKLLRVE